ncbi:hypothetical protein ACFY4F_25140 [Peribacillus butanolivorans]|uniref:hypothetical protein n=1 Tax=Peribacillus butanolivorans TaxID=421767 RepID=UPI0036C6C055
MRFQQQFNLLDSLTTSFLILGNPNIHVKRERVSKIEVPLDKLGVIKCWVEENEV